MTSLAKTDCSSTEVASSTPFASRTSSALGGDLLVLGQLVERHSDQPVALEDMPPDQARRDPAGDDRHHQQEDQGAGTAIGPGEHQSPFVAPSGDGLGVSWSN